jgi:hypothetical protein
MTAVKKGGVSTVPLQIKEKVGFQLDSLYMDIILGVTELTKEAEKIKEAQQRIGDAKRRMMKLLGEL